MRALCLLLVAATAWAQTAPVLIDTDAGSDDFMAIALLLSDPSVTIDAVTVVNGLAHVGPGARNITRLLDLAGRDQVPVFAGRETPLRGTVEFPPEWRKIADDLPGVDLPASSRPPERKPAAAYLVDRLRTGPPVRILALGPLTNLAEALTHAPAIAKNIQEIVIMGGAFHASGNLGDGGVFHTKNTTAEWNIFVDPLAASIVFKSGIPIRLIALDATNKVPISPEFLREFESKAHSPVGRAVTEVLKADRETIDAGIFYAWDPLAAAALLKPAIVKTLPVHIEVRQDPPEEGRTVETPGKPNANVAIDADAAAFRALFLQAFALQRR
ncbi:MAG TPA: nucleoside hydrolase [Bryobacteraceae bacterium]|nr:nucleoside hydrolase [Bryobacteraceae bacterium]